MNHKGVRIRDHKSEINLFRNRVIVAFIGIFIFTFVLVGNLYKLQVENFESYQTRADGNRIKVLPIAPTRGLIYDRNGVLLAENQLVFDLTMIPEQTDDVDLMLEKLHKFIPRNPEQITRFKKRYHNTRRFKSVTILENLTEKEIAKFSVHQYQFPGLSIDTSLKRFYPNGEVLTHILGYVAHINDSDLRKLGEQGIEANYQATTVIGKLGVERYYEDILHGIKGYQEVEVNSRGRIVRTIEYVPPVAGKDIVLNIDLELQKYVFEQLNHRTEELIKAK